MKRTFLTTLAIAFTMAMNAQTPFEKAMSESFMLFDSAKTVNNWQAIAGRFERISLNETNRWEPIYYIAFAQIQASFSEKDGDKKDAILDLAEKNIEKAFTLNGDKSELYTLQGFVYQGRIRVSAMRGMTYSQKAAEVLEKAIKENPENPRAYFLLGQNIYFTPKMFGGGCKNALPKYMAAKEKFEKENGKRGIDPHWGAKLNLRAIERCNSEK